MIEDDTEVAHFLVKGLRESGCILERIPPRLVTIAAAPAGYFDSAAHDLRAPLPGLRTRIGDRAGIALRATTLACLIIQRAGVWLR